MDSKDQIKLYETLLNKVNDAIIAVSNNGDLLFHNNAAQQMVGFPDRVSRQEWLDYFEFMKPGSKTKLDRRIHPVFRALRDERIVNEELILSPKKKILRPVRINASSLSLGNEKEGIIIVIQDITSEKQTEEKLNRRSKSLIQAYEGLRRAEAGLKNTNLELEKRVMERTKHLTRMNKTLENEILIRKKAEEQINKTNSELIKTNRDLDNFIYTASHGLRTPISNIEGLIHALKDEDSYSIQSTKILIDLINESVEKFKITIADLTEISKVQKEEVDIVETVSFENALGSTKLAINDLICTTRTKIIADFSGCQDIVFSKKNLTSIFYNLISNSIKFRSPDKDPVIHIRSERQNKYCLLSISDNGMGIESDKKEQIFSMFRRLHDHVEGSGIGLFLVKRILENTGGKIEVNSSINEGTEFKIYFPN